jgi:hypothetical protein
LCPDKQEACDFIYFLQIKAEQKIKSSVSCLSEQKGRSNFDCPTWSSMITVVDFMAKQATGTHCHALAHMPT